jgi:tRNA pseudouridine(55) synthase
MEILVYKRIGETTAELSSRIKNKYDSQKVAICGKLDPMARGLTRVLTDDKTKLMDNFLKNDKTYEFNIVLGIKTDTDDIMGMIKSIDITGNHYIEDIKSKIDDICSFKEQHFHPFSAIKIKIGDKRQSLHQWTQERNMDMLQLPKKNVQVLSKEYGDIQTISIDNYYKNIKNRLGTINMKHISTFRVPEILTSWDECMQTMHKSDVKYITILPVKLRVSSGFYIRMLPYYLDKIYNVQSHIYDINRVRL